MNTVFRTLMYAACIGLSVSAISSATAADPAPAPAPSAKSLPDDSHFKSGEPVEADSFYRLQEDMEPNGISSGPPEGCPYDEEAIGQPLLG